MLRNERIQLTVIPALPGYFAVFGFDKDMKPAKEAIIAWRIETLEHSGEFIRESHESLYERITPITTDGDVPSSQRYCILTPDGTWDFPGDRRLHEPEEANAYFRELEERDDELERIRAASEKNSLRNGAENG